MFRKRMEFQLHSAYLMYLMRGGKHPRLVRKTLWIWGPPVYATGYLAGWVRKAFKRSN